MIGAERLLQAVNHSEQESHYRIMSHPSETLREFQALFETLNKEAERNRVRALCKK